ncbi:MAG: AtpZ/AtpI family protein [Crocinitomicaceae bacterium]|nr:AtpZ/AtpI family protein [Crocinitomicaceae bacterium]
MPDKPVKSKKKISNPFLRFSGIAFQMGILIAFGAWGGSELDKAAHNQKPVYAVIFSLLAIAISLYLIIKEAIRLGNDDK